MVSLILRILISKISFFAGLMEAKAKKNLCFYELLIIIDLNNNKFHPK